MRFTNQSNVAKKTCNCQSYFIECMHRTKIVAHRHEVNLGVFHVFFATVTFDAPCCGTPAWSGVGIQQLVLRAAALISVEFQLHHVTLGLLKACLISSLIQYIQQYIRSVSSHSMYQPPCCVGRYVRFEASQLPHLSKQRHCMQQLAWPTTASVGYIPEFQIQSDCNCGLYFGLAVVGRPGSSTQCLCFSHLLACIPCSLAAVLSCANCSCFLAAAEYVRHSVHCGLSFLTSDTCAITVALADV